MVRGECVTEDAGTSVGLWLPATRSVLRLTGGSLATELGLPVASPMHRA